MALASKKRKLFDDRYEILSIVGRGSRSVVYHARLLSDSSAEVALKVLLDQKDHVSNSEKLRKEALAMVSSRHRYVVRLDDFHSVGALCYLSMEYAPESDLRKYTEKAGGTLGIKQAEQFMLQAAKALSFIHRSGILHRDIKPDNLLVINEKEIRIADFGVALLSGDNSSLEELQRGIGTLNYMPPEVLKGTQIDRTSDVYSLAVTFYEMLSGKHPFADAPLAKQLEAREDENIPELRSLRPEVPRYLSNAIRKAMSYNPSDRFLNAEKLIEAIVEDRPNKAIKSTEKAKSKTPQPMKKTDRPKAKEKSESAPKTSVPKNFVPKPQESAPPTKEPTESGENQKVKNDLSPENRTAVAFLQSHNKKASSTPAKTSPVLEQKDRTEDVPAVKSAGLEKTELAEKIEKKLDYSADETIVMNQEEARKVVKAKGKKALPQNILDRYIPHSKRKKLVITGLLLIAILYFGNSVLRSGESPTLPEGFSHAELPKGISFIPAYEGEALSFPELPSGLYAGTITGLQPGNTSSFSIISLADSNELIVISGIEGWVPTVTNIDSSIYRGLNQEVTLPLRVSSSGFVLDFTGEVLDDEIIGFFRNIITGDTGEWRVRPIT